MTNTQTALLNKIRAQKDGLPVARVPMIQKHEMHALIDSGLVKLVEIDNHGRKSMRLMTV